MTELSTSDLRRFITTITQNDIRPFLDLKKVCASNIYLHAIDLSIHEAVINGNLNFVNALYALVVDTRFEHEFLAKIRIKFDFVISDTKPRRLKKATPEQEKQAVKNVELHPKKLDSTKRFGNLKRKKPSTDIMDSRVMLPGSFGNGKKR